MVGGTEIGFGMEWDGTGRMGRATRGYVSQSVGQGEYSRCVGWIEMDVMNHGRMGQMSRDGWGTDG